MSLANKGGGGGKAITFPSVVNVTDISTKYATSSPVNPRAKRHGPSRKLSPSEKNDADVVLELGGQFNDERPKRRKGHRRRSHGNCGGWLPWANTALLTILALLVLVMYLNWVGAGSEVMLSRLEIEGNAKSRRSVEGLEHKLHNHTHRIQFSVDAIPKQFTRYPEEGTYIKELDPYTLVEHRLCCHINEHVFICDYGQGASHNMALECIVEYTKKGQAFLKIYIQSKEMSGAKCSFSWITLDPNEVTEVKKSEVGGDEM